MDLLNSSKSLKWLNRPSHDHKTETTQSGEYNISDVGEQEGFCGN
jgi:hypothetical protein